MYVVGFPPWQGAARKGAYLQCNPKSIFMLSDLSDLCYNVISSIWHQTGDPVLLNTESGWDCPDVGISSVSGSANWLPTRGLRTVFCWRDCRGKGQRLDDSNVSPKLSIYPPRSLVFPTLMPSQDFFIENINLSLNHFIWRRRRGIIPNRFSDTNTSIM
mgnify:CR=1 FL=1